MAFEMFSDDDSIYLTAPTTPTTPYRENLNFCGAPTSPILHAYKPTFDHAKTEPTTPKGCAYDYYDDDYEDENNNLIEFKFETSHCDTPDDYDFDRMVQGFESLSQQNTKESLPTTAFTDELFRDGKVMPLKPPPGLQKGSCNNVSSCLSSPRSPTAALKLPFSRRRLWNDDFDPFLVALEKIKRGNEEMRNKEKDQRMSRSVSLLQARSPQRPNESMNCHYSDINRFGADKNTLMEPDGPHSTCVRRLVKMGHEKARTGESGGKKSEESLGRGSKRKSIKKLQFRFASAGRANNEEKRKNQSVKKSFTMKFSFRSTRNGIAQCHEEKRVSQVTKVTVMQYMPRLCMGYGAKYVK